MKWLTSQFRCNGSGYLAWIDNLGIRETANDMLDPMNLILEFSIIQMI